MLNIIQIRVFSKREINLSKLDESLLTANEFPYVTSFNSTNSCYLLLFSTNSIGMLLILLSTLL